MRLRSYAVLVGGGLMALGFWRGCATGPAAGNNAGGGGGSSQQEGTVDVNLSPEARRFVVEAGVPVQHTDTAAVQFPGETVTGGTLSIEPSAITFTPGAAGKAAPSLQGATVIEVTVWIGPLDLGDMTCGTGDQYGPFEVTLDAGGTAVSVQPSSVPLKQGTIDLLPQFIVCIQVDVPDVINATIEIATLTLKLDVASGSCVSPGDCPEGFACREGRCVDSRDPEDEIRYNEDNFPDCATASFEVDPGDIFCRSNADCPADTECCTGPEICRSNPCACR